MSEELNLLPCPMCGDQPVAYEVEDPRCVGFSCKCGLTSPQSYETKGQHPSWNAAASAWNDLPRALVWTTEPPKEHGWYWLRRLGCKKVKMVDFVYDEHGGSFFGLQIPVTNLNGFEWAGPIPMPKEKAE